MPNHYYFVSYVEASEKPFTTNQIKSTIVETDSDYKTYGFIPAIKREISWKDDINIISLTKMD